MFQSGSSQDMLMQYEFVSQKAKRIGKIFGSCSAALVGLISLIALVASGNATAGSLVGTLAVVVIAYIVFYQMGKCYPWAYYWLLTKTDGSIALVITLFLGFYLGLALRFKYHSFDKKQS